MGSKISRRSKKTIKHHLLTLGVSLLFAGLCSLPAAAATHHHPRHQLHTAALHHTGHHNALHHHSLAAVTPHAGATLHEAAYHEETPHYDYRRYISYYSHGRRHYRLHYASARYWHSGIQCVPYAREVSHIDLSGDAFLWWAEAAGRYQRGTVPEEGAVLNFRGIGRMPLGHVAVVTSVVDSRTILVTQANWVRGSITNDVTMQDVSPNNDWSQVEVELGDSSTWGAPYPTYGFIYNRAATGAGTIIAATAQGNEVAEAPAAAGMTDDAPDRDLQ